MVNFIVWLFIPIGIAVVLIILNYFLTRKKPTKQLNQGSQNNSTTPTSKKSKWLGKIGGAVGVIIGICIVVFIASYAWNFGSSLFEEKLKPIKATHTIIEHIPTKGIPLYLHPGWKSYPKGRIKIINPNGKVFYDSPGITYYRGYQPEGWYYFISEDELSVEITIKDTY